MIEHEGKFYVTVAFTDKGFAEMFEQSIDDRGSIWAGQCVLAEPPTKAITQTVAGNVNGPVTQIGALGVHRYNGGMYDGA